LIALKTLASSLSTNNIPTFIKALKSKIPKILVLLPTSMSVAKSSFIALQKAFILILLPIIRSV